MFYFLTSLNSLAFTFRYNVPPTPVQMLLKLLPRLNLKLLSLHGAIDIQAEAGQSPITIATLCPVLETLLLPTQPDFYIGCSQHLVSRLPSTLTSFSGPYPGELNSSWLPTSLTSLELAPQLLEYASFHQMLVCLIALPKLSSLKLEIDAPVSFPVKTNAATAPTFDLPSLTSLSLTYSRAAVPFFSAIAAPLLHTCHLTSEASSAASRTSLS